MSARSALLTAVFYLAAFDAACRDRRVLCRAPGRLRDAHQVDRGEPAADGAGASPVDRRRTADAPRAAARGASWARYAGRAAGGILYRWLLLPPWVVASARQPDVTPRIYFQTQWSALLYYLRLFVWPDALVVDRLDYPWARSLGDVQAWGSLLVLAALAVAAWRLSRVRLAFGFCALWVVITLAPESSVFPLAEAVNEHRPYLAMLGLATIAALALWLVATAVGAPARAPPAGCSRSA